MKIFVDSGILVEYMKGNHIEFYEALISNNYDLNINQVVISEYLFHFIAINANKSPLSAKMSHQIPDVFRDKKPFDLMPDFRHLQCNEHINELSVELMIKYNLLPNDALILATCKHNNIKNLASYDSDFENACKNENITILKEINDLPK